MGSGGTEWEVADVVSASRMNTKTVFIGTGAQIAALSPTYAGQEVFCTSTGSNFVINRRYMRNAANTFWYIMPASQLVIDDFSSYADQDDADAAWLTTSTAMLRANPTTDVLNINFNTVGSPDTPTISHDFESINNSKWLVRFKLTLSTITAPGNFDYAMFLYLSSTSGLASTAQDAIGLLMSVVAAGTKIYSVFDRDGANPYNASPATGDANFAHAPAVETLYVEIKRTSATAYTINLYSDPAYSTLVESQSGTCAATTSGLRYLKFQFLDNSGHATGAVVGTIDDVILFDGITSV